MRVRIPRATQRELAAKPRAIRLLWVLRFRGEGRDEVRHAWSPRILRGLVEDQGMPFDGGFLLDFNSGKMLRFTSIDVIRRVLHDWETYFHDSRWWPESVAG